MPTDTAATEPGKPPRDKGTPGDCAVWDADRRFWCTLPAGHFPPHVSINQGRIMARWTGGGRD